MKNKLFAIPFLALIVALSACSSENPSVSEKPSDSILDSRILEVAVKNANIEKCDEIMDAERKVECQNIVTGLNITTNAVAKRDLKLCDTIGLERYRENCQKEVQYELDSEKRDKEQQEADNKKAAKILEIEAKAIAQGDVGICDQIEDENQKYSCRYNIVVNQAIQKKDPSLCDKIGEKERIGICKQSLQ